MKVKIKGYIAPKEKELFEDCADRYAYNETKGYNKFAISDGVSRSFFPEIWADTLVRNWVKSKDFDESTIIENCQKDWLQNVTQIVSNPETKWFTKNAFKRKEAGLATFVSLQFFEKKDMWFWRASALGDSFLFFVPLNFKNFKTDVIKLSSKSEPIEFDNFPDYLISIGNKHKGEKQSEEQPLSEGTFLLMTDALAEWFINERENAISKTEAWKDQTDFERFLNEERQSNLGNDDSAILIIKVEDDNKDDLSYDLETSNISNINELIEKQQKEIEAEVLKNQENNLETEAVPESESSLEEVDDDESLENEISEETLVNIEDPKKGFIKKSFENFIHLVYGKKEESKLGSEIEALSEEPEATTEVNPTKIIEADKFNERATEHPGQENIEPEVKPVEKNNPLEISETGRTNEESTKHPDQENIEPEVKPEKDNPSEVSEEGRTNEESTKHPDQENIEREVKPTKSDDSSQHGENQVKLENPIVENQIKEPEKETIDKESSGLKSHPLKKEIKNITDKF